MIAWIDVIGWTLVHFVWEGALIALATSGGLRLLRRAAAQARYGAACAGLLLALAAPPVTLVALLAGPPLDRPGLPGVTVVTVDRANATTHTSVLPVSGGTSLSRLPVEAGTLNGTLQVFVIGWAAGVLLLTVRLASGWFHLRRLHRTALAAPASRWLDTAASIAARLRLRRPIHVIDSPQVVTPAVIGWLQPVVLLPIAALANLTPAQVQAILAHELAHVRRHDFVVNLLQTLAETLLFYHPGVWWLSARIRTEREHCCDDIAVDVCGDAVEYAEALTALAAFSRERLTERAGGRLAMAATGGALLSRVRRLLRLPDESGRGRAVVPMVIAATVLLVALAGTRLVIVAQTTSPAVHDGHRGPLGPLEVNRILGFDLFPGPVQYASDDPRDARAWDVKVAYPGGEMSFLGFTARGLIRFAYALDRLPVVDGPAWMDSEPQAIRGETSAAAPGDQDFRDALRVALETEYGIRVRRSARLFPVYGLQVVERGRLGPNIRPAAVDCVEDIRARPDLLGLSLHGRGQVIVPFCGTDNGITGIVGRRATLEQLARALRGFGMGPQQAGIPEPEVIDQTGLSGVYDFELNLGFFPFAAIKTAHPVMGIGFGPMIRTFPEALQDQLGLRLVPSEAARDVVVIESARRAHRRSASDIEQRAALDRNP